MTQVHSLSSNMWIALHILIVKPARIRTRETSKPFIRVFPLHNGTERLSADTPGLDVEQPKVDKLYGESESAFHVIQTRWVVFILFFFNLRFLSCLLLHSFAFRC